MNRHEPVSPARTMRPRVALYSHDTQGLGHIRRNLLLASVFQPMGCEPVILLLSGVREAGAFAIPPSVDSVTLPALTKVEEGGYGSRSLRVPVGDVVDLRRRIACAALESFDPDVLIVDKVPRGALNELDDVLAMLRRKGRTRLVLGLREVLDEPAVVAREWRDGGYDEAIDRYYDRVWVYGDPRVYDPAEEYGFSPRVREKVRYTGYLNPAAGFAPSEGSGGTPSAKACVPAGPYVLCAVGGGQDGAPLARAFLGATLPAGRAGVLVTGPQMPEAARREFREAAARRGDMTVLEFVTDCRPVLARAERVICMGGYNTVCEVMSCGAPALVVPRVHPRREQWIRARRLSRLGLVDCLHPDEADAGGLSAWLTSAGPRPARADDSRVDLGGAERLPKLLEEVLGGAGEVARAVR